ncbi:SNF2 helicase associated domain-containing protein [candidate division KSB1 bacterium]|nr:SNF2 helicase associated domain-containing protein [candidate division KSB1 bacterium]
MIINIEDIIQEVGRTIFKRGVTYMQQGRVQITEIDDQTLNADVKGSETYHVEVEQDGDHLESHCTCPFPLTCKHIVAALLTARDHYQKILPEVEEDAVDWEEYFHTWLKPHMPEKTEPDAGGQWQAVFVLSLEQESWSIKPQKVYIKQDGSWGRMAGLPEIDPKESDLIFAPSDPLIVSHLKRLDERQRNDTSGFRGRAALFYSHTFRLEYGAPYGHLFESLRQSALWTEQTGGTFQPVQYDEKPCSIQLSLLKQNQGWRIISEIKIGRKKMVLDDRFKILTTDPVWMLWENRLIVVSNLKHADLAVPFTLGHPPPLIPDAELDHFFESVYPNILEKTDLPLPEGIQIEEYRNIDGKSLELIESDRVLEIHIHFNYAGREIAFNDPNSRHFMSQDGTVRAIIRDLKGEQAIWDHLVETGLKPTKNGALRATGSKALNWLFNHLSRLEKEGFQISGREQLDRFKIRTGEPNIRFKVSSKIDWFDLNIEVDVEGVRLPIKTLKKALRMQSRIVRLEDDSLARLSEPWYEKLSTLFQIVNVDDETTQVNRFHVTLIDRLLHDAERETDQSFEDLVDRLRNFSGIKRQLLPKGFKGKLRHYQKAGLNWIFFLKEYGFGGCLADDMGLGKTIQALALLQKEKETGVTNPTLIAAPTSVVFNWMREIERFTPQLTVHLHTGLNRTELTKLNLKPNIILTTYGILLRDIIKFREIQFHYVILDESQKIKNPDSQTSKAVRLLQAAYRLVLTGTPVENNTLELWSQFAFLNPGLLGSLYQFKQTFATPIEKHEDESQAKLLHQLIFPFILRRTKDHVAPELPPKHEQIVLCPMGENQAILYRSWRDHYRALLLDRIDQQGMDQTRFHVLQGLSKLRQVACHPNLIEPDNDYESGKFETLKEFISEITSENHKILIFSQYVRMLKLVRGFCDAEHFTYEYLIGSTRNREQVVERFQTDENIQLFLISLKAGGTGLNLTAAEYVIHIDPWWNPAVEMQATDRAHRIGQDKPVFVYRLITKDSVEEKMLELQRRKKALVDNLIRTDSTFFKSLSRNDVEILFS